MINNYLHLSIVIRITIQNYKFKKYPVRNSKIFYFTGLQKQKYCVFFFQHLDFK